MHTMLDSDEAPKLYIDVEVSEPVVFVTPWHVKYSTFQISIKTNHWAFTLNESTSRRRYADFRWLRQRLHEHHPTIKLPTLPPRKLFTVNRHTQEFLMERCQGLAEFLRNLMKNQVWLSERALHLLLQSNLSIQDIDANLQGKRDDTPIPDINYIVVDTPSSGDGSVFDDSLSVEEMPIMGKRYSPTHSSEPSLYDGDSDCDHIPTIQEEDEELQEEALAKNKPQILLMPIVS